MTAAVLLQGRDGGRPARNNRHALTAESIQVAMADNNSRPTQRTPPTIPVTG